MSNRPNLYVPRMGRHKATNQARVVIDGEHIYLGKWGSQKADEEYARVISEYVGNFGVKETTSPPISITIEELLLPYIRFASSYYVQGEQPTSELHCIRMALRPLRRMFGETRAVDFGPNKLRAVRESFIAKGWARKTVNDSVARIVRMFKWAVSHELIPETTYRALATVEGLKKGRSDATDTEPRCPANPEHINVVRDDVRQRTRDLIDLQLLSGARPGELLRLTTEMLTSRDSNWIAILSSHKTRHLGKSRILVFGPRAKLILSRYSQPSNPTALLFGGFTVSGYRRAIARACERTGTPRWTPHQLRHNAATMLRERFGAEAAQVVLGHAHLNTTEIYAEKSVRKAMEIIAEVG